MKKNSILLIRLSKEIELETIGISKLLEEFSDLPKSSEIYLLRAKASIFHDFYTALERIFRKIAEELNGGVPKSVQWHKDLLITMTLHLDEVRPPIISKETIEPLSLFLRFRHLFRNNYGYEIQPGKLAELETIFPSTAEQTLAEIETFRSWMEGEA